MEKYSPLRIVSQLRRSAFSACRQARLESRQDDAPTGGMTTAYEHLLFLPEAWMTESVRCSKMSLRYKKIDKRDSFP